MIDRAASVSVGDALFDGLPDVDLVREVVPAGPGRELVDQALSVRADVVGISHAWKVWRATFGRKRPDVSEPSGHIECRVVK